MKIQKGIPKQNPLVKLDKQLKKASQLYEKQFLKEMVKAMRGTVSHSKMTKPSMAEKIYKDQLDDQYVNEWVETGGTGFSKIIYDQMVERFYPQLKGHVQNKIKSLGPKDQYRGMDLQKIPTKTKKD